MTTVEAAGLRCPAPGSERAARTAVQWCGRSMTYGQLEAAVAALAERLAAAGAAGASVLVMGPLSPAYLVGLQAAWRAGAVPVPVDAGLTAQQYGWLEQRTCPAAVVSHDATPADQYRGASGGVTELVLDSATGAVLLETAPPTERPARPTRRFPDPDAGYVIPTSGSTGEPKAIVGSRHGLDLFLDWFREEFALTDTDRCAAVTRVNFDPSLRELFGVLGAGGVLSLPPVDAQLDLPALADHLVDSDPTVAFLVPSIATRLAEEPRLGPAALPRLRLLFFAGEVLGRRVVEQWAAIAPGAEIVNLYGQTEATLAQLYRRDVQDLDHGDARSIPVGVPRPGVRVDLRDPDDTGVGEVLLTSPAPALGLLGAATGDRHELTPFPVPLPTGDLGRRSEDGALVIVGRAGNDLKFGGRRVSFQPLIDDIEALPGVRQCVVVDHGGPQLFVTTVPGAAPAEDLLAATVHGLGRGRRLPRFTLRLRADLPMLRSGKIDRRALLASLDRLAAGPAEETAAAEGHEVEQHLHALLGTDEGTLSLVDAGVSSLDMLAAVSSVHRVYGVRLTVAESFGLRDVPALAREIDRRRRPRGGAVGTDRVSLPAATAAAPERYPLSSRQLAYMWVCMAGGNANWCNISREIPLPHRPSESELGEAIGRLLARHDALGLALAPGWQEQTWTAPEELSCAVSVVDTDAATDTPAFRDCVQATRTALVAEPIDPEAAPAIRAALVRGSTGSSVVLVAHHLFVDGLGLDVLAGELRAALSGGPEVGSLDGGEDSGVDSGGDRDGGGYRAFCLATARETEPGPAAAYWRSLLAGATQVELPEATGPGTEQGELLSLPLGAVCTRRIHTIAQESGVSAFTVALAAFERAVADTFGLDRPAVIVVSQNRGDSDAAVVGNFTTSLIVRGPGAASLRENIGAMASQLADGTRYGDWEFDQRIADPGLAATSRFPLSTVLFNQRPMPRDLRARDLGAWSPRALGRALRYQLQGELQMSGPEMVMTYYYRKGISGADEIGRVHRALLRAIRSGEEATGA
ncbi:acyl-CoA synthetase (AMP-forming)/AMP-acid ligase II [Streptomyces sp. 1114.5]|uniref:AMP-binding protein n=1 Tax=Streptomyces sp. 1114.5 TaxID=1938830 RepID=UPI000EB2B6CA|nr:AMP-binding protein [Streptomyces sp. 1114.5]RKT19013.1 acyl-CoA synthetase (AMP-forming)/AMP-acid ligase II [Streptomyces sp. 1114.5]